MDTQETGSAVTFEEENRWPGRGLGQGTGPERRVLKSILRAGVAILKHVQLQRKISLSGYRPVSVAFSSRQDLGLLIVSQINSINFYSPLMNPNEMGASVGEARCGEGAQITRHPFLSSFRTSPGTSTVNLPLPSVPATIGTSSRRERGSSRSVAHRQALDDRAGTQVSCVTSVTGPASLLPGFPS